MENSKSERSNTGYKGIFFNKEQGTFRTRLILNKDSKTFEIGNFETLKEAIRAREDFIKSLF